ncbi:MAG: hypothetical protein ACYTJ0_16255, partial [Planctomycetota bacterium]
MNVNSISFAGGLPGMRAVAVIVMLSIGLPTGAAVPPGSGACCLPNGTCEDVLASGAQATCEGMGGVFQGEGSTCAELEAACPKPGACCLPDG